MADYSLKVIDNEDQMKNYFRNKTGRQYKDTLIVTVKNTGKKYWERFKGQIKCLESNSNIFFETISMGEDVAPNGSIELVLTFPREERNCGAGDMLTTLQLSYKDVDYNSQQIGFFKKFDLTGITVIGPKKKPVVDEQKKIEEEERERKLIEEMNRRIEEKRREEERRNEEYRRLEEQRRKDEQQRIKDEKKRKEEEKKMEEEKKKKADEESIKQDRKRIIEEGRKKRDEEKKSIT